MPPEWPAISQGNHKPSFANACHLHHLMSTDALSPSPAGRQQPHPRRPTRRHVAPAIRALALRTRYPGRVMCTGPIPARPFAAGRARHGPTPSTVHTRQGRTPYDQPHPRRHARNRPGTTDWRADQPTSPNSEHPRTDLVGNTAKARTSTSFPRFAGGTRGGDR
jgi:hypothetical protein